MQRFAVILFSSLLARADGVQQEVIHQESGTSLPFLDAVPDSAWEDICFMNFQDVDYIGAPCSYDPTAKPVGVLWSTNIDPSDSYSRRSGTSISFYLLPYPRV